MTDSNQNIDQNETGTTPDFIFPQPTGDYAVGTTSYHFVDPEREETYTEDENDNREITAKIWYPSDSVADTATEPYLNPELSAAVASELEIPAEDLVSVTQSLATNSIADAPIAEADSEYPVLVFSHGFGGLPEFNTIKAEELASQGYVVVGINHTYDSIANTLGDGEAIPQSSVFDVEDQELLKLGESVNIRAEDAQFILDELEKIDAGDDPKGLFNGQLDLEKVGIYGYSLGGATAAKVLAEDPRFIAGINLDGGLFGDSANASLSQPFMILNNEAFGKGTSSSPEENQFNQIQQSFVENLQNDGYEVTILGTEHSSFNDLSSLVPLLLNSGIELGKLEEVVGSSNNEDFEPIDPELSSKIINDYNLAFFDQYLNNEPSSLLAEDMSSTYPEVIFQAYTDDNTTDDMEVATTEAENDATDVSDGDILGVGKVLVGEQGSDRFFSSFDGGSTFTGSAGADQFWIAVGELTDSPNIVTDFDQTEDLLGVSGLSIGFEDLSISQQGDDTLIKVDSNELAILKGVDSSSLGSDAFIFA